MKPILPPVISAAVLCVLGCVEPPTNTEEPSEVCPRAFDRDGDGFLSCYDCEADVPGLSDSAQPCDGTESDCDDSLFAVNPGRDEVCDGRDTDCDGQALAEETADNDADGAPNCLDCAEKDPTVFPGADDTACDGVDTDCNTSVPPGDLDMDGDGHLPTPCGGDCDDNNPAVFSGAQELCGNGLDDNCDGLSADMTDEDLDGYGPCDGDCDDSVCAVSPAAEEVCDGIDNDCNPTTDELLDRDSDGFTICSGDCDDEAVEVQPQAVEVCDGVDNDCDGELDEDYDSDGDGFTVCGPDGVAGTLDDDCDDADATIAPGAVEQPGDGLDSDCDGADAFVCAGVPEESPGLDDLLSWALAIPEPPLLQLATSQSGYGRTLFGDCISTYGLAEGTEWGPPDLAAGRLRRWLADRESPYTLDEGRSWDEAEALWFRSETQNVAVEGGGFERRRMDYYAGMYSLWTIDERADAWVRACGSGAAGLVGRAGVTNWSDYRAGYDPISMEHWVDGSVTWTDFTTSFSVEIDYHSLLDGYSSTGDATITFAGEAGTETWTIDLDGWSNNPCRTVVDSNGAVVQTTCIEPPFY